MKVINPSELSEERVGEIAALINERNQLPKAYTSKIIKAYARDKSFCFIIETDERNNLIGVIEVQKVQWYQCEIRHLAVKQEYTKKGIGAKLIYAALQEAIKFNARIAQCTIRNNNAASASVFNKHGFVVTSQFFNKTSGNTVNVYQLDLTKDKVQEIFH